MINQNENENDKYTKYKKYHRKMSICSNEHLHWKLNLLKN